MESVNKVADFVNGQRFRRLQDDTNNCISALHNKNEAREIIYEREQEEDQKSQRPYKDDQEAPK